MPVKAKKGVNIASAFKFFCKDENGNNNTTLMKFKEEWSQLTDADKKEICDGIDQQQAA